MLVDVQHREVKESCDWLGSIMLKQNGETFTTEYNLHKHGDEGPLKL